MEYIILAVMIGGMVVATAQLFGDTIVNQFCLASHALLGDPDSACEDAEGEGTEPDEEGFVDIEDTPSGPTGPQTVEIRRVEVRGDVGTEGLAVSIEGRVTGEIEILDNGQRIFRVTGLGGVGGAAGGGQGIKVDLGDAEGGVFGKAEAKATGMVGVGHEYEIPPGMSDADFLLWLNAQAAGLTFDQFGIIGLATKWWIGQENWPERTAISLIAEGGLTGELSGIAGILDLPLGPLSTPGATGASAGASVGASRSGELTAYSNGEFGFAMSGEAAASIYGMLGVNNGSTADVFGGGVEGVGEARAELIYDPATGEARVEADFGVWSLDGTEFTQTTVVFEVNPDLIQNPPDSFAELIEGANVTQSQTIYDVITDDYGVSVGIGPAGGELGVETQILRPRP